MTDDRAEFLARIATLYYYDDLSQQEIADQVAVSRSNVSRLLKEARNAGIVEITIRHPLHREVALERRLAEQFGLREVGVCQTVVNDPQATLDRVARLAARLLDSYLQHARVLGISWGTTVHAIAHTFRPARHYDVEVVQMMGGVGAAEPAIDGPALAQRLARGLTGRHRYLHAPLIVDTPEIAQALLAQRNIAETLQLAANADVALVGIGTLEPDVSSLLRAGYLTPEEFDRIRAAGAVGDICGRHFDIHGQPVAAEIDARLISITHAAIARLPLVIGAAASAIKAPAILGALRGRYLDVLVTDSAAAERILTLAAHM
jgi:DNA-binding transcriptional regulator LsrR (DeoR family)